MDILEQVGQKIKEIRKSRGMSQEALGEKAGLSANYIGQVERGQKQVTLTTLARIAESLEVEIGLLFETSSQKSIRSGKNEELRLLLKSAKILSLNDLKVARLLVEHLSKRLS